MSKFIITCPVCHRYAEASTGFFATRRIHCSCGNTINVKTDRMASRSCPSCGNHVVYDQAEGTSARCPICANALVRPADFNNLVHFSCSVCGCHLQAEKQMKTITCPVCDHVADVQAEMHLAQVRQDGVPAVIRYEGDGQTLVRRHPLTDFVTGTQLIVHESQEAVFLRNGEALDSFGPGRYTLETGSMPKLERIYGAPVQGQPFHAEVYFVDLTSQMGVKWGTPSKVGLFDPATGMHVELGASGTFNLRVSDARRLLIRLVGTADSLTRDQLFSTNGSGYFRGVVVTQVKAQLARVIKNNRIGVLELDAHLDTISTALQDAINATLSDYGVEMTEFLVNSIATPDDDPNFRRMKQQYADSYLRVREEEIRRAEAEAIFERKTVEAQTAARMKVLDAQGDADAARIRAQAEADAYRMQAEAEAQEMRMKGYTYQQETARQVSMEAMRHAGEGGIPTTPGGTGVSGVSGLVGDMMQLGVGLNVMGSVVGMTRDAIQPVLNQAGGLLGGWDCTCGQKGVSTAFCPACGARKPAPAATWNCACGQTGLATPFCPACGARKPAPAATWNCTCGQTGLTTPFCPACGHKKED